jgi:hypothetical protein
VTDFFRDLSPAGDRRVPPPTTGTGQNSLRLHGDPDADLLRLPTTDAGPLRPWQPGE